MDIGIALITIALIGAVLQKGKKDTDKAMEKLK
jgi:hypothetical protein